MNIIIIRTDSNCGIQRFKVNAWKIKRMHSKLQKYGIEVKDEQEKLVPYNDTDTRKVIFDPQTVSDQERKLGSRNANAMYVFIFNLYLQLLSFCGLSKH